MFFHFSFSLYKSLGISALDKFQATLKVIILDVTDDLKEKDSIFDVVLNEEKKSTTLSLYILEF